LGVNQRSGPLARHDPRSRESEVADSKRRGDDAADEFLDDEAFDDAVDDDTDDAPVSRSGGTATKARPKADSGDKTAKTKESTRKVGFFGRIGRFFREVVAELRKVIWPSRKELRNYAVVVIVFVAVMLTIVGLLDLGFARAVLWVFGNK
jgi:preprotein translocase subunit SecE